MDKKSATQTTQTLKVLYDGACPMCSREIALYQGLEARTPVAYCDISDDRTTLPEGLSRDTVLARFHVQKASGEVVSGARAFVALWRQLPGWRWLARLADLPGVTPLLELAYRAFLPVRPWIQRLVPARARSGGSC